MGKENKLGEKTTREASCSHRLPLLPFTQTSKQPWGGERTQLPAAYDAPTDTPKQQVSKDPQEQAGNWRGFNSISP